MFYMYIIVLIEYTSMQVRKSSKSPCLAEIVFTVIQYFDDILRSY